MPRPPIDLTRKIKDILQHQGPLPPEAEVPLEHFERSVADVWNMLLYFERMVDELQRQQVTLYPTVLKRHFIRLNSMMLVNLIESFERFLKELAAVCVDHVAEFVLDKRFEEFQVKGSVLAAHFRQGTLGKSLCESDTWLDCRDINDRFRKLLANPFETGNFYVFPQPGQLQAGQLYRFTPMSILWQLRHTIVHNVGVITHSDAVKFRFHSHETLPSPGLLQATRDDVHHVTRFLRETAEDINQRVGHRLADLLTTLHAHHGAAFDLQTKADELSQQFGFVLQVAGLAGVVPP